ncbi:MULTISPECIES: GerMN domain-containing protein [Streptomyces]|uniref:GerMN domain-containing protein n=1 Tax=Streptomyces ramulosus TaxID=47762 RepID=A0ABW1FL67_9ACTN
MRRGVCGAVLLAVCAVGCGVDSAGPDPVGAPASGLPAAAPARHARLYFASPYGLRATVREVPAPATPQQALDLLLKGPDVAEQNRGLTTEVPPDLRRTTARVARGGVDLYIPLPVSSITGGGLGLQQIVCTVANASIPGAGHAPDVDVRVHEEGYETVWTVRCDATGTVHPASRS